jgi:hypothetical protein
MRAMVPARSATAAMLLGAAAGCGVGAEQSATLAQMTPAMGYSDVALPADIYGKGFRPTYRFDAVSGDSALDVSGFGATLAATPSPASRGSYDLPDVIWESDTILGAQIPAGLPAGMYDLIVRDPRGHTARQPMAFTSLGPDTTPPTVTVASPSDGAAIAAGAPLAVVVAADDGLGQIASLGVMVSTSAGLIAVPACPVTGGSSAACTFTVTAPAPVSDTDALTVDAVATDEVGLTGERRVVLALVRAPVPTGISPAKGSTLGGTVVTLSGADFVAGATSVSFDAQPASIQTVTPTTLTLLTPPHAAGQAVVTVTSAGASATLAGTFTFVAPPTVRGIDPTSGPAAGYVPITIVGESFSPSTVITFDGVPLLCPTFVNANRIQGLVPPGAGTAAVAASDSIGGSLPSANVPFTYTGVLAGPSDASASDAATAPDGGCPGGAP